MSDCTTSGPRRDIAPSTAPLSLHVNEFATLLHALLDDYERSPSTRVAGRTTWRSPDGRLEVRRERPRVRPATLFRQSMKAQRSRLVLLFDGVRCFEQREAVWQDPVADIAECARVEISRGCFDRVMAYHETHRTWVVRRYRPPSTEARRMPPMPRVRDFRPPRMPRRPATTTVDVAAPWVRSAA